jgi:hypothetical protein
LRKTKDTCFYFVGICPKLQIAVNFLKGISLVTLPDESTYTRTLCDYKWRVNEVNFHFMNGKYMDTTHYNLRWFDPVFREIDFLHVNNIKSSWMIGSDEPLKQIFDQWNAEGYEQPYTSISKMSWEEDGYHHTITLVQGKRIPLQDDTFQQRKYWLHTRWSNGQWETVDWKEEILIFENDTVRDRLIKTPETVQ